MSAVRDALGRLRAAERVPFGGTLSTAIDADRTLGGLLHAIEELAKAPRPDPLPTRATLADARAAWAASGGDIARLSGRAIRAMCWDTDSALDPAFVRAAGTHPDLPRSRRWLEGLALAYFARWRTMPEPATLEALLRKSVGEFGGRSERLVRYRTAAAHLFSPDAATRLAEALVADRQPIDEFLHDWKIDPSSSLGEAVANATVDEWTRRFTREQRTLRGAAAMGWVTHLTQELLASRMVGAAAFTRAVSALILWDQAEQDPSLQAAIRTFLLEDARFRDPRLPNRNANWDLCAPEAYRRVVGWLAKGDLLFFFKFVIQEDPHRRRDFWLRYISQAVDASVALSDDDATRLKAQVKEKLSYSRIDGDQGTSAFLMRFHGASRDLLCIEFSKSGNALYVHDADAFVTRNKSLRRPRFHLRDDLKNGTTLIEKFIHHASLWKHRTQSYLARYGIRPN